MTKLRILCGAAANFKEISKLTQINEHSDSQIFIAFQVEISSSNFPTLRNSLLLELVYIFIPITKLGGEYELKVKNLRQSGLLF